MKRILALLIALATSTVAATDYCPYIGFDYMINHLNLSGVNDFIFARQGKGLNFYYGHPLTENLYVESGYNFARTRNWGTQLRMKNIHASLAVYYPIAPEFDVQVFGAAGASHLVHHTTGKAWRLQMQRVVPKVTAGLEYSFTESFIFRLSTHWETSKPLTRKDTKYRNIYSSNLGLKYQF